MWIRNLLRECVQESIAYLKNDRKDKERNIWMQKVHWFIEYEYAYENDKTFNQIWYIE